MASSKAFFLAYGGAETTVFDSQVIDFLARQKNRDLPLQFIGFQNWQSWLHQKDFMANKIRRIAQASGYEPLFLPRFPKNIFRLNTLSLKRSLQHHGPVKLIHARGLQSAAMAVAMKKYFPDLRVILDHRGVEPEEFLYIIRGEKMRRPNFLDKRWYWHLKKLEKEAIDGADYIFCVSHALQEHVLTNHPRAADKIAVVPGCVDLERFPNNDTLRLKIRQELNINGRLCIVYAGSLRAWQSPAMLAETLQSALEANLDPFLLILTPHRHLALGSMEQMGIDPSRFKVLTTTHQTTPHYLAAGDIGIAIRDNDIINRVASPTKSGEYLAAGNLILTTPCPSDLSSIVKKEKAGFVLPYPFDKNYLQEGLKTLAAQRREEPSIRERMRQVAARYYDWTKYQNIVTTAYDRLLLPGI